MVSLEEMGRKEQNSREHFSTLSNVKTTGQGSNGKGGEGWQSMRSNCVCLEFFVGYFFCFKTKKVTNLQLKQAVEPPNENLSPCCCFLNS